MPPLALTLIPLCNGLLLYYFQLSAQDNFNIFLILCMFLILLYWQKQYLPPNYSLSEKKIEWDVMWRQFVSSKEFVKPQRIHYSLGMYFFRIVYNLRRITIYVESIIFVSQYWDLGMYADLTCEFISGMTTPYIRHWSYAHINFYSYKSYVIV